MWTDAVARTVEAGLAGIECLAGIPGSAGATPIQNVGAYGQEVSATITEVVAYDRRTRQTVTLGNEECAFSYRHSRFKSDPERYVVLRVRFGLEDAGGLSGPVKYAETARVLGVAPGERVPLATARETVLKLRAGKGMVLDPRTTTPGRPVPSSPTRSSPTRTSPCSARACGSGSATAWSPRRTPRARAAPRPPPPG